MSFEKLRTFSVNQSNLTKMSFLSVIVFLGACTTGGNGSYVSGHQVGINRSQQIYDIDNYRVEVAELRSARNFPIPETRYFSFSWSPSGHQRQLEKRGWRLPTDKDWQNFLNLRLKATDWSRYGNATEAQNSLTEYHQGLQTDQASSEYKARVRQDGWIIRDLCNGKVSGRHHCANGLTITPQNKLRLAQIALDRFEVGCTLGQVDPQSVTALVPYYKSGPLSIIAEVVCD